LFTAVPVTYDILPVPQITICFGLTRYIIPVYIHP
jgi:hypothetical protein